MSIQALSWVLDHSESTGSERLVLIALANHASSDEWTCYPSMQTIAREARVHEDTARRAVFALEAAGAIRVDRTRGRRSNTYHLLRPTPATREGSESPTPAPREGSETGPAGAQPPHLVGPTLAPTRVEPSRNRTTTPQPPSRAMGEQPRRLRGTNPRARGESPRQLAAAEAAAKAAELSRAAFVQTVAMTLTAELELEGPVATHLAMRAIDAGATTLAGALELAEAELHPPAALEAGP